MNGRRVQLETLKEEHRSDPRIAAADERIWINTLAVVTGPGFDAWFDDALAARDAGKLIPFAVRRYRHRRLVGSTSYLDTELRHKRVEIGSTWYHPTAWGTEVNADCKLLLLEHAFEELKVSRVAFITDSCNAHSQAAIAKLGAVFEGVCRSHMVRQGGLVRDSVIFSIIAAEWPQASARLLSRVACLDRVRLHGAC